ncbi:hypothetical protein AUJ46_01295 [Candidatus Peregrinibacteria bacterium CG1_02_54_53]|nr:MAG: hypothetical protein AUJ46_01295 [Candidatus Peregrinibacteria bacterium CG1_02_54_53]
MNNHDLALVEHSARAVNTILDAIYQRKPAAAPEEPVSDCYNAPFEAVMKDLLACSACGRLCSDGSLSI